MRHVLRPAPTAFAVGFLLASACAHPPARAGNPGGSPAAAARVETRAPAADTVAYRAMRRRLAGFSGVAGAADSVRAFDFLALRSAFAGSSDYSPYDVDTDLRKAMFGALEGSKFADASRLADSALALNYLDIFAHVGAGMAARGANDEQADRFHEALVGGLLAAILASGKGTAQSPWVVLSIDEEYAVLQAQGLRRTEQMLGKCDDGRACDVLTVTDAEGGSPRQLYFDITAPRTWMMHRFEGR
jgi:hypothetical protein